MVNARDLVKKQLTSNKPLTAALGLALQDAVSCGCNAGTCIWCAPGKRDRNSTLTYDMGGGARGVSNGTVPLPKTVEQLMSMAAKLMS